MNRRQERKPSFGDLLDPGDHRVVNPQRVGVSAGGMVSTQPYHAPSRWAWSSLLLPVLAARP